MDIIKTPEELEEKMGDTLASYKQTKAIVRGKKKTPFIVEGQRKSSGFQKRPFTVADGTSPEINPPRQDRPREAYEWVLVFFKEEEEAYLTEKQYEYYKQHREDRFIDFDAFGFAPSGVMKAFRRPAQKIKEMYPCKKCYGNGYLITSSTPKDICPECGGTGVMPL